MDVPVFSTSPDPTCMYLTPALKKAVAKIRTAVARKQGLCCIFGDVGMGKSSLLRPYGENTRRGVRAGKDGIVGSMVDSYHARSFSLGTTLSFVTGLVNQELLTELLASDSSSTIESVG
jgi:hypothetical protein